MTEIVNLKGEALKPDEKAEYDVTIVEMLEGTIKDVKAGRVDGIAILCTVPADITEDGAEQISVEWKGKKLTLLAAASRLVFRLNKVIDENSYPER